jgi:hypothetical protein
MIVIFICSWEFITKLVVFYHEEPKRDILLAVKQGGTIKKNFSQSFPAHEVFFCPSPRNLIQKEKVEIGLEQDVYGADAMDRISTESTLIEKI